MRPLGTQHGTVVLGHSTEATLARVYAAFTDPLELARLGMAGGGPRLILDEADFRVGGGDRYRLGTGTHPRFDGQTLYHDIVPARRLVTTDIVASGDVTLTVALSTLEFASVGQHTKIKLTAQVVTLVEEDEVCSRYAILFANLDCHLGVAALTLRQPPLLRR